jgi:hypothetical protein
MPSQQILRLKQEWVSGSVKNRGEIDHQDFTAWLSDQGQAVVFLLSVCVNR